MSRTGGRIEAVDLARGFALVGMMFTHIGPPWIGEDPPVGDMLAGGRAAPLFAMLAGVALTIVHLRDPRGAGSTKATWIRAALLVVLGLALGSLEHVPVYIILVYYGVMIVVVLPFRRLTTRSLVILGTVWAIVVPIPLLWAQRAHDTVITDQTEWADVRHPGQLLMEVGVWGVYPITVWIAYVLIGLAVGRLDPLQAGVLRIKLEFLEQWNAEREALVSLYLEQLRDISDIRLPVVAENCTHVWHLFVVQCPQRDALQQHLTAGVLITFQMSVRFCGSVSFHAPASCVFFPKAAAL